MIGSFAIILTISLVKIPAAESPRNMSAPSITSASCVPSMSCTYDFLDSSKPSRCVVSKPRESATMIFSFLAPSAQSRFKHERAAAPAPDATILISSIFLPLICNALRSAEPTIIEVPCWSSWNTGIFMRSRSFCSM